MSAERSSLIHNRVESLEVSAWQRHPGHARGRTARRDQSGQTDFEALSSLPFGGLFEGPADVPPSELKACKRAERLGWGRASAAAWL